MYRCCRKVLVLIFCAFVACFANNELEDSYIFELLEVLDQGDYKSAIEIYKKLYESTQKAEYIKELARLSNHLGDFQNALEYAQKYNELDSNDLENRELLGIIYINLANFDEAIKIYEDLYKSQKRFEYAKMLSNLYALKKDIDKSQLYLLEVFKVEPDEFTLLFIASNDITRARFEDSEKLIKEFFESEISDGFAQVIMELSLQHGIGEKVEKLFLDYYKKNPSDNNALNLVRLYLREEKIKDSIEILEKNSFDTKLLVQLYMIDKKYERAQSLANSELDSSGDEYFLGILAIIDFEKEEDKKNILDSVISRLKRAIVASSDHVFLNYLGYLLIDFDINIESGMDYIRDALAQDPDNVAYIDSLAWGFFKMGDCQTAKREIERIPQSELEKEEEIKAHLEAIDKCLKN